MQKTLYIPIDTTIQNTIECDKLIKRGDTLTLQIKVFTNGVLADLTGQTIDLILRKSDNTLIEKTITSVANGVITCALTEQATLVKGIVSGEVQIYDTTTHLATNTFTFIVVESIADDVLAASSNEIETLIDLKSVIDINNLIISQYVANITAIAGTTSSVEALVNIKAYIDNNLIALQQANATATANIATETTKNTEATNNIANLTTLNNTASTLKTGLDADISTGNMLKTNLEADLASGSTLKTNLESDLATGNTLKINIDAENVRAENNIAAMQGFGDVTALTQNVTNLKSEVEAARNGEASLDNRLDKSDLIVAGHTTQLSEKASLYIAETLPAIADRKEKTMYLKITDIVNANTSNNLKVSPTMGLKIV